MTPHRATLVLPRLTARGLYVGQAACVIAEHHHRDLLARTVHGYVEVTLGPFGRADVATATDVYEVEPIGRWRHGLRQAVAYAAGSGCRANLALFGAATGETWLRIHTTLRDSDVALWRLDGALWSRVTARTHCRVSRDPAVPTVCEACGGAMTVGQVGRHYSCLEAAP